MEPDPPDQLRPTAPLLFRAPVTEVAELPQPDSATEAAVRRALGRRGPLRSAATPRSPAPASGDRPEPVDRLDLLAAALTPELTALVVLWLGGTRRGSPQTRIAYADDLLLWAAWARRELGRERFGLDLHRADVTMWLTQQQDAGAAESSIARRLSSLTSLYRYAESWGLPVVCPVSVDDHRPRYRRGRGPGSARALEVDEVAAMLTAAGGLLDAVVVGLLFTGALRVSELCAADAAGLVDEGARRWLVVTRKGGAKAQVALDAAVAGLVDEYLARRPDWAGPGPAPLLVDAVGRRLDRHDVARILRRLARAGGIPRPETVTPHSLRTAAITDQNRRGLRAEDIQEHSGHADIRTVMVYVGDAGRRERVAAITDDLGRVMAAVPGRVLSG